MIDTENRFSGIPTQPINQVDLLDAVMVAGEIVQCIFVNEINKRL